MTNKFLILLLALASFRGYSQSLEIGATLDATSRFYDYFSDAYAEVSLNPDGFYQIDNPSTQYGSYEVFPNETEFSLGTLSYDGSGLTGSGDESAPVTGLELDLDAWVDTDGNAYHTAFSELTGSLALKDGVPQSLSLNAKVTLTYTSGLITGLSFSGTISVTDNVFALDVDTTNATPLGPLRLRWALTGTANLPPPRASVGALLVNFTTRLTPETFLGPDSINPYLPGNALHAFIATTGETNVLDADGQFYLSGWDGSDGTFTSNVTPGTRFLLHSPLMERLEADTWRVEGPSNHGVQTGAGEPIVQRSKFLLPTAKTYGTATLTIENGVPTELTYLLDFSVPGVPGFEGTALQSIEFRTISLSSAGAEFGAAQTYEIGVSDDAVPYGLHTALSPGSYSRNVLTSTVLNTTRGILRQELFANTDEIGGSTPNISTEGRLNGETFPSSPTPEGQVYLEDPFLGESGTLTVFNATGLVTSVNASVAALPATLVIAPNDSGNAVSLSWFGIADLYYQLQTSASLPADNWTDVGDVRSGAGAEITVNADLLEGDRFFRVLTSNTP